MLRHSMRGAIAAAVVLVGIIAPFEVQAQAPTFTPAQRVCEGAGGIFITKEGDSYSCLFSAPTAHNVNSAQALCEHAYGGLFVPEDDAYTCVLPH